MSDIFLREKFENKFDNININVKVIYKKFPIDKKVNKKSNQVNFTNSYFHKLYRNPLIPIKIRNYLWHYFRRTFLDLSYFEEFKKYWGKVIEGRPFWNINDLFFLKNLYRTKFQYVQVPDTDKSDVHLKAYQRPEVIYQLLHLVCRESSINDYTLLRLINKKKRYKIRKFLEFGCATAPFTTSFCEFFKIPKKIKIFISDIQTLAFHYGAYKFRNCSNIIPILLVPENDFLLILDESLDLIICNTVFEHLNKPFETIKIFYELLNKNGLLVFDYIKTSGEGLDTHHGIREREAVLDFINNHFQIIYGKISKQKSMGTTIAKKQ